MASRGSRMNRDGRIQPARMPGTSSVVIPAARVALRMVEDRVRVQPMLHDADVISQASSSTRETGRRLGRPLPPPHASEQDLRKPTEGSPLPDTYCRPATESRSDPGPALEGCAPGSRLPGKEEIARTWSGCCRGLLRIPELRELHHPMRSSTLPSTRSSPPGSSLMIVLSLEHSPQSC